MPVDNIISRTFLPENHMRRHCFQNASLTGDVCDLHNRLTAKPHIGDTFNTKVNISLALCSTHIIDSMAKAVAGHCFKCTDNVFWL